ncbi:MAG: hypothetical protein M1817_005714 [Caeruleum heppii]|nr:MAG: hypothetical protein M1817_005714 [Caeruleum heppii]
MSDWHFRRRAGTSSPNHIHAKPATFDPNTNPSANRVREARIREEISRVKVIRAKRHAAAQYQRDTARLRPTEQWLRADLQQSTQKPSAGSTTAADDKASVFRDEVRKGLRQRNFLRLLKAVLSASNTPSAITSIPDPTWAEVFQMLDPDPLLESYKRVIQYFSQHQSVSHSIEPIEVVFREFFAAIENIGRARRQAGSTFGLSDYTFLLKCARAVEDGRLARKLWKDMLNDDVSPDTECFNSLLAAQCWSGTHQPSYRQKLRVTPRHVMLREQKHRVTGFDNIRFGYGGLRSYVLSRFNEMTDRGLVGDATTFSLVMIAMGREGDLDGVKAILQQVWNVDVDALLKSDETDLEPVKAYPATSPLHPRAEVLFAVAHTFGANNDVPTALRVVDYVSRQYGLRIPVRVWDQLMEWTYVLSVPRYGPLRKLDVSNGQLPRTSVETFWETMTATPYHVRPTMPMFDRLIKMQFYQHRIRSALARMEQALDLYRQSRVVYKQADQKYQRTRTVLEENHLDPSTDVSLYRLRRLRDDAQLTRTRDNLYICRWTRLLLGFRLTSGGADGDWERRALPQLVGRWQQWMPMRIRYRTTGGSVEIRLRDRERRGRPVRVGVLGLMEDGFDEVEADDVEDAAA